MPAPQPFPCGGNGQKPCPPVPAIAKGTPGGPVYTLEEMHAYGDACYQKGRADAKEPTQQEADDWRDGPPGDGKGRGKR